MKNKFETYIKLNIHSQQYKIDSLCFKRLKCKAIAILIYVYTFIKVILISLITNYLKDV